MTQFLMFDSVEQAIAIFWIVVAVTLVYKFVRSFINGYRGIKSK
jgi:hypothetical protein